MNRSEQSDALRVVRDQLMAGSNRSMLSLDPTTRDSYAGGIIQVSHHLACVLKTPCCVTDPNVQLPFIVQVTRRYMLAQTMHSCDTACSHPPFIVQPRLPTAAAAIPTAEVKLPRT